MNKKELKKYLEEINVYNYEKDEDEIYTEIYNKVIDYMNETQDWNLEEFFNDYVDYDYAEEMAKAEIDNGGLLRLTYFLGDTHFYNESLFKINGYGNLENVNRDDLETLKEELLDNIEDEIEGDN